MSVKDTIGYNEDGKEETQSYTGRALGAFGSAVGKSVTAPYEAADYISERPKETVAGGATVATAVGYAALAHPEETNEALNAFSNLF